MNVVTLLTTIYKLIRYYRRPHVILIGIESNNQNELYAKRLQIECSLQTMALVREILYDVINEELNQEELLFYAKEILNNDNDTADQS